MAKQVTIEVNGKAFQVELPDFEKEKESLKWTKAQYLDGEISYQPIWEREDSAKELVLADLDSMISYLEEIETDFDVLIPHVEAVRKKKNGDFWKNSGTDVLIAENCTEYFTDFTNAWSVLMIRLDVETADTCTLSVRHRTFT